MGCASSIVPQQQPTQPHPGRFGRPKRKLNALVPEPPARPAAPAPGGPRVGLVSPVGPSASEPTRAAAPPPAAVSNPQSYEEVCVAFLKAVKRGDVPTMEQVAQLGVRLTPTPQSLVNIRGMWDSTPLIYAAQYAHSAAAHWLLARGADVLAQNEKGVTALLLASLEGLTDVCERILSVAALMGSGGDGRDREQDGRGLTAPRAVDQQVGAVYNAAADVNVRLSPLLAASMNGHAGVAALLLAHGADPNRPVGSMATGGVAVGAKQFALLLAAKYGHAAVLELLLSHGADCAVRDTGSSHAVLLACEHRREDCALLLLRHAAYDQVGSNGAVVARRNVWLQPNRHGLTALHLAATHGLVVAATALVALAREQSAVDSGGSEENEGLRGFLDAVSVTRGETALLMACRKRQFEVARVLLGAGADGARADRGGTTPAHVLERSEQPELLAKCLAAAASVALMSATDAEKAACDRQALNGQDTATHDRRGGGEQQAACEPSGADAEGGSGEAAASGRDSSAEAETARLLLLQKPSGLGATPGKDSVTGNERGLLEAFGGVDRGTEGGGDRADSGGSFAGAGSRGEPSSELADGPSSAVKAPSTFASPSTGVSDAFVKPDETASGASATVAPTAEDIELVTRMEAAVEEQRGGDAASLASNFQEPTAMLSALTIERGGEAIAAEPASPRRTETEGMDEDGASSTASASPTKERTKKSSKRKKKRDHSGQDQTSSTRRHRRHHRHDATEKSAATDEGGAAEVSPAADRLDSDGGPAPAAR